MAVISDKLGPGRLTIGEVGSPQEFGTQLTKAAIEPKSEEGDSIMVLSGDRVSDDGADSFELTGTVFEQHSMQGLAAWSKTNSGKQLPFTFVPSTAGSLKVTGRITVRRIGIGGDVGKRNQLDFTFPGVGDYELSSWSEDADE